MIVVTSLHNEAFEPLAEWTLYKNKKRYCEKHGYTLHYATDGGDEVSGLKMMAKLPPIPDTHHPMGWGKIYLMKDAMDKYPNVEWVLNADCDVMITNMEIKLEDVVAEHTHSNTHILVSSDCSGINCGIMMVRNTPIGRAFLDTIIVGEPLYRHWYLFENQLIQDMLVGHYFWDEHMKAGGSCWSDVANVLRQRVMNSYDYKNLPLLKDRPNHNDIWGESGQWQEGDFMIQWPGTDLEYRINAAKEMFAKLKYDE
jgi:hypothetical protein